MLQTRSAALAAVAALFLLAPSARAQVFVGAGGPVALNPAAAAYSSSYSVPATSFGGSFLVSEPAVPPPVPYSYYVLAPLPSRGYVGYGSNDFAFHGVAYGQPYDRWSWGYMGGYYNSLNRYFTPPL